MDYRTFTGAVKEQLEKKMTGGVRVSLYTAVKNNGKERTGVLLETPGINISPTIYLEEYYESYLRGKTVEDIANELKELYDNIKREESWDCERILTYEGVRDRIVFKLINTAKNRRFLSTVPHRMFLDLSIVFYVLLESNTEGTAAMAVSNNHARRWDVCTETLWADAVKNVRKLLPAEFVTMNCALRQMLRQSSGCEDTEEPENLLYGNVREDEGLYVLSNSMRNYGAACMAYPHVMEMIGEILKKDYYILPSSVHEVVIVPYSREISRRDMDDMVREINETQVAEEEVLSNHVYLYERRSGRLLGKSAARAGGSVG